MNTPPRTGDTGSSRGDARPVEPAGTSTSPNASASAVFQPACRFDLDTGRAWLHGANPAGNGTVAQALRIVNDSDSGSDSDFDIYGFDKWVRISDLLAAAQRAGVLGLDNASIGVLHLAGERGFVNAHRFTLTTPGYPTVCSDEVDTLDLLTDHLSGVDAAVHLLAQAAHTADVLLHQRTQLAVLSAHFDAPSPLATRTFPKPAATQGFRPLAIDPRTPAPPAAPARDGTATTTRHHR